VQPFHGHWFARLFPRPVFAGDAERTRIAAVSNDLIGVILVCFAIYVAVALATGLYQNIGNLMIGCATWAVVLLLRMILVRGRVRLATFLVALVICASSILIAFRIGTIHGAHAAWALVAIVYAVLALGPGSGAMLTVLGMGFFGWIALQEAHGAILGSPSSRIGGQWIMMIAQSVILLVIGSLVRRHMVDAVELANVEHLALKAVREEKRELLESVNRTLEIRVAERTEELRQANADLQRASQHLLQSEKLAALGGLVAGVAHELNTPIGNARLTATSISARMEEMAVQVRSGRVSRSALEEFFDSGLRSMELIERATERSGDLVESFKQIAVDQTAMQRRKFDLQRTAEQTVMMLGPMLKRTACVVQVEIPPNIEMDGHPGALEQIINNFVTNSLMHAFPGRDAGHMLLSAVDLGDWIELRVRDDGVGIAADIRERIFEPFFTTRFGHGGSGLGLYTVYNLVTSIFGGTITVDAESECGAGFTMRLARIAPKQDIPPGG
jgi:signal transduction histidine kinase